ncbi:MAG: sulfatase-like hydrolase/transferase [Bacteroidota bacterium]
MNSLNRSNLLLLLSIIVCACTSEQEVSKPNVLFIFTDDQTYTAVSTLGNPEVLTPNMDRLVNLGTSFTNAYNMGAWNGAVCAASRAMLISGRSLWNVNEFRNKWKSGDSIALSQTWPKLMEEAGYETYMSGKWHVDVPAEKVFQNVQHVRPGMPRDRWEHSKMVKLFDNEIANGDLTADEIMPLGYNRPLDETDTLWSPSDTTLSGFWQGGKHWSEVLRDDALDFLGRAQESDSPFFMYLAFNAPHDPRQAPMEFLDMYHLDELSLPASWQPQHPLKDPMGTGRRVRDEALAPFPRTEYATKVHLQEYYVSITHLDHQIGLILDRLEDLGMEENTYIIFTSDHGLAMGKHGLLGKQNLYEHSMKPPFVIVGPGIPKNRRVDTPIYLQDAMATSLEIAGIPKPDFVEFNSVLGLADGSETKSFYEDGIYGGFIGYQRSIRKGNHKLIVIPAAKEIMLFDLKNDPEEMVDLSKDLDKKELISVLFEDLEALQIQFNDTLKLDPKHFL